MSNITNIILDNTDKLSFPFPAPWYMSNLIGEIGWLVKIMLISFVATRTFIVIINWLAKRFKNKDILYILNILFFPGIIIHELSHAIMCFILRIKMDKIVLFSNNNKGGYVASDDFYNRSFISNALSALAPLILGTIILYYSEQLFQLPKINVSLKYLLLYIDISIIFSCGPSLADISWIFKPFYYQPKKSLRDLLLIGASLIIYSFMQEINTIELKYINFIYLNMLNLLLLQLVLYFGVKYIYKLLKYISNSLNMTRRPEKIYKEKIIPKVSVVKRKPVLYRANNQKRDPMQDEIYIKTMVGNSGVKNIANSEKELTSFEIGKHDLADLIDPDL
ncbi:MAG: hypothetical protein ACTSU2_03125 [Promethearchaeota archaeon]